MLSALSIRNFTIIDTLALDFSAGFTIFTGETGAGKSILIDALLLTLGERAESRMLRNDKAPCEITAQFRCAPNTSARHWLAEHSFTIEEDSLIIRRVVDASGRSKAYLNDVPVSLQSLKQLAALLVHLHGQHDQHCLTQPSMHRAQLDAYAQHSELLAEVGAAYQKLIHIEQQIMAAQDANTQRDRLALLEFQYQELSQLCLDEEELETLPQRHQLLHKAQDHLITVDALRELFQGDEGHTIGQRLHQALQLLRQLPANNKNVSQIQEMLDQMGILCTEAEDQLEHFTQDISLDPEQLQQVEQRLSQLHHMARKYQIELKALPELFQHIQHELSVLKQSQGDVERLRQEYADSIAKYDVFAKKLHDSRLMFAKDLGLRIGEHIRLLGMPHALFHVQVTPQDKRTAHGHDKVEYGIQTNPGTPLQALNLIASGGELSRISLAIHHILAETHTVPTLIFDEVDVGISGGTAALVGEHLQSLSQKVQVLCVTHQAQVACHANHHFRVHKHTEQEQTYSQVQYLCAEEKIEELARMLGGRVITEQTRKHAQELLGAV